MCQAHTAAAEALLGSGHGEWESGVQVVAQGGLAVELERGDEDGEGVDEEFVQGGEGS